jgi:hypothetical protein
MKITNGKKSIFAVLAVGAISLVLASPQAQANSISGAIGFSGSYTLPAGQNLGDATELLGIDAVVVSGLGVYSGIAHFTTTAAFANPLQVSSTPAPLLWTVVSGGNTYTFGATTSTVTEQGFVTSAGSYELNMGGKGWAEINGVDQTAGTWVITASETGLAVGFESSASVVGVPDTGMTLGLLGSAMLGLQGLRRKLGC